MSKNEAREALQAIVRVCTQLELDRPQQDALSLQACLDRGEDRRAQSVLLAAVRTIDEYLTGSGETLPAFLQGEVLGYTGRET